MGITVYHAHIYDDVTLLASTDPAANAWRLEVEDDQEPVWLPIDAVIMDSHLNWSTPDLTLWDALRRGEPTAIKKEFPKASPVIPAGPFAVMWDVSDWYYTPRNPRTGKNYRFRFTDPDGAEFEFHTSVLEKCQPFFG
jgi:hypothetical protein